MDDSAYDKIPNHKHLKMLFKRKPDQSDGLVTAEKVEVGGIPMVLVDGEVLMTIAYFDRHYHP